MPPVFVGHDIYRQAAYGTHHPLAIPRVSGWLAHWGEMLEQDHECRRRVEELRQIRIGMVEAPADHRVGVESRATVGPDVTACHVLHEEGDGHDEAGGEIAKDVGPEVTLVQVLITPIDGGQVK